MRSAVGVWLAGIVLATAMGCSKGDAEAQPLANIPAAPSGAETPQNPVALDEGEPAPRVAAPAGESLRPRVEFDTSHGRIVVRLDGEKAPLSVDNFLSYVDSGHYNGTLFHQVYDRYIALGGAYDAQLRERQTRTPVRNEADNGLTNRRGTIAMARVIDVIDSSTAQFFFNLDDNEELNHKGEEPEQFGYCVFGEVVEGMEALDRIGKARTRDEGEFVSLPAEPIVIKSIRRLR